jgi:hypothetical protein
MTAPPRLRPGPPLNSGALPHGKIYAAAVRRFQHNFLRERVCTDLDEAFARAVDTCERLIPVFKLQAA